MQEREPSVLDYFKSIFESPESFERFLRSLFTPGAETEPLVVHTETSVVETSAEAPAPVTLNSIPFRTFFALVAALIGQRFFEPPDQQAGTGIAFYVIAFGLTLWALFVGEWRIVSFPAFETRIDSLKVKVIPFGLGLGAALIAFFTFTDNVFTAFNVSIWLTSIALFVIAFWEGGISPRSILASVDGLFRRDAWTIKITRWTVLLLLVAGIVVFFRMSDITGIPAEPFSDHAEKLLDVWDATHGLPYIFFERNTGREFFQFYWTALIIAIFNTGYTFFSLKLGTVLLGLLTLPYIYWLGKEVGSPRVGLLAMLLAGMSYWGNIVARIGLRFPLYPLFTAPVLYFLFRGLRTQNRNDFIFAGIFLGLGLHGYSPFRVVPIIFVVAILLYLLHAQSKGQRLQALWFLSIAALIAMIVFLPLLRYMIQFPAQVAYRSLTRVGTLERDLPGSIPEIFFGNLWNGIRMLNWQDGEIWVNSVPYRPALDVVSGALFLIGVLILLVRYVRDRHWLDLFLLLSVPLLMMPSILSLAFPGENPAINRAGGALVPVFLIIAIALDGFYDSIKLSAGGSRARSALASGVLIILLAWSGLQSYDLVFRQYNEQFRAGIWNTSDMGKVIISFVDAGNPQENAWVVPFPYWVDTRLVGIWAGYPTRDFAKWRDQLPTTLDVAGAKLFLVKDEDQETLEVLKQLYPKGALSKKESLYPGKSFWIYFVPDEIANP